MKTINLSTLAIALLIAPVGVWAQSSSTVSKSSSQEQKLSDANIAAIVVAANDIDIKAGKLALKTSGNSNVKGLGEMMVRDHEAVNQQAKDLVKKLNVKPEENALSRKLKSDADKTFDGLKAKKGADFDQAYVANEIAYHEAVISVVDTQLIPGAANAELKTLLQQVRPALQTHLEHAKHVQSQLK